MKYLYFVLFIYLVYRVFSLIFAKFISSNFYSRVRSSFSSFFVNLRKYKLFSFLHNIVVFFRRLFLKNYVEIYFGLPGSGKTTVSAFLARKYRKADLPVWSNEPLSGCYSFNPKTDIGHYDISNGLLLVDECGSWFNNREFKSNFLPEQRDWWRRHRHARCHIACFSQSWNDSDIDLRRLSYKYWLCKRSIFRNFVVCVPIYRKIDIDEITHEPVDKFYFPHILLRPFVSRHIYGPSVWKDFDSWAMPALPPKVWKTW